MGVVITYPKIKNISDLTFWTLFKFKMASKLKTCSLREQRAVIRLVTAEGVKTSVIRSRMKEQYGESCMSQTICYRWVDEFKNGN